MAVILLDRWTSTAFAGRSLRDVVCGQWVGIDGGRGWSGIVARSGTAIKCAATVGFAPGETLPRNRVPDVDDYAAWGPYWQRVVDVADEMIDALDTSQPVRVVVEHMGRPGPRARISVKDWVPGLGLIAAVIGRFSTVYVVRPQTLGDRHTRGNGGNGQADEYYARNLIGGKRPSTWPPNDHPSGTRQHERSASDLIAIADIQLRAETLDTVEQMLIGKELAYAT